MGDGSRTYVRRCGRAGARTGAARSRFRQPDADSIQDNLTFRGWSAARADGGVFSAVLALGCSAERSQCLVMFLLVRPGAARRRLSKRSASDLVAQTLHRAGL